MYINSVQTVETKSYVEEKSPVQADVEVKESVMPDRKEAAPDKAVSVDVRESVKNANMILGAMNTQLQFVIDERTDSVVVKIMDMKSGEVIKQIPPEEVLNLMAKLQETIIGVLVDDKA